MPLGFGPEGGGAKGEQPRRTTIVENFASDVGVVSVCVCMIQFNPLCGVVRVCLQTVQFNPLSGTLTHSPSCCSMRSRPAS
jgi:hypothetical protein